MSSRAPPTSRRERPAKSALSREGIVAAAVDLLHREGLERVTMRRLATELDTGPASLYVYVRDTGDLHAAVLDALLGTVDLASTPAMKDASWQDRLVEVLSSYTRVLFQHPGLARAALFTQPNGPRYLDLLERLLELLAEGGVAADRAAWVVDLLLQRATATAAEHNGRKELEQSREFNDLRSTLRGVSRATHPHIAAVAGELLSGTGPERLRWSFQVLLNGVLSTPRSP